MPLSRNLRNLGLTAHITFSIGWFGAVSSFLVLAIAGVSSEKSQLVRAAYIAMELISWYVIVPFCLASFISGVVQSLITQWGLIRHYWIVAKLVLTILATIILLLHMTPISQLGEVATNQYLSGDQLYALRVQLIADAAAALLVLIATIAISIYKPWGRTFLGIQNSNKQKKPNTIQVNRYWIKLVLLTLFILVIITFIILHLLKGGAHH